MEARLRTALGAAALAAAVAAVYGNSLDSSFHYDDFHSIVDNPHIRSLSRAGTFFTGTEPFSADPAKAMYRPLLLVTYAINHAVGGYEVTGYHVVNALLHLAAALLVWSLSRALGLGRDRALAAGLIFAVHPLCTEPVNYISSRSELLAACLYLAALRLHLAAGARVRAASVACYGLALLSKSVAVTLPAALWLLEVARGTRPQVRRHVPYWLITAAYVAILVATGFAFTSAAAAPRGPAAQMWTQLKAVPYYLSLIAMPVHLNVEHQFGVSTGPAAAALLGGGVLGSLLWLAWHSRRGQVGFWLAWPVLVSLPAALVPLNVLVNERRLYLPLAGLCILVVGRVGRQGRWRSGALGVAVAVLAVLAVQRNAVWADEAALWSDAVRKSPRMPRAHVHLGNALQRAGRTAEAAAAFARAVELDSAHRAARTNLANLLYEQATAPGSSASKERQRDLLERAAAEYRAVLDLDPGFREALTNLGSTYLALGRPGAAEAAYRRAVAADPNFGDGHYNLGRLYLQQDQYGRAARSLERATALQPERADGHLQLGNARALAGDLAAAATAYRRACDLAPGLPAAWYNLGEALLRLAMDARGEARARRPSLLREARTAYGRAAALDGDYRLVRQRLDLIRKATGEESP